MAAKRSSRDQKLSAPDEKRLGEVEVFYEGARGTKVVYETPIPTLRTLHHLDKDISKHEMRDTK